jgi:hypothetical protein
MKNLVTILLIALCCSCNLVVEKDNKRDTVINMEKVDTTLENAGDSIKAKYKEVRDDIKLKFKKDSSYKKLQ